MASIFKRKNKGPYIVAYFDAEGIRREKSSRTTDYRAAQQLAGKLEADAMLRREGVIDLRQDRYAIEARRPLLEHLDEFKKGLTAKGVTAEQVQLVDSRARRIVTLCNAQTLADLTPHAVQTAIGTLRNGGSSVQTANHYLRAIKQFTRWLARDGRIQADPIQYLKTANAETDRRHVRRALSDEELVRIVDAAETGPTVLKMSGPDRAMLYRVATGTGFRAAELGSLTPAAFDLDAATVTVEAAYSKHRRQDVQPIRSDLVAHLQPWLKGKPAGEPVFSVPDRSAEIVQADLKAAREAWLNEAKDDARERDARERSDFLAYKDHADRVADFHSLRHTYITRLVTAGASVKVVQELARHSTPTLTFGRYAHTRAHDLTGALDALPDLDPSENQKAVAVATGTDAVAATVDKAPTPHQPQQSAHNSQQSDASGRETHDAPHHAATRAAAERNYPTAARVSGAVRSCAKGNGEGGSFTRRPRLRLRYGRL